ncbi:CotO family spore coat protein [Oceanobacillus bengalensis]|uniref:Spore coat protein CotO n=1 Tax=Oceanobacillus bengalensis TaxID=1435466 RepID=A0A494YVB5_9BACI|nr:CotO family spore coat protein [Oceanobacillus bengalensis]RKQ14134.1 hypothetical protein D8M05_13970 [Oceanobacillus bengalensis]
MGNKRFAKDPMLFIQQPKITIPKAPMQEHYVSPRKRKEKEAEAVKSADSNKTEVPKVRGRKNTFVNSKPEEAIDEPKATFNKNRDVDQEEQSQQKKRKQFKEMTIKERIEYFLKSSSATPTLKCEIKVSGRSHRGIISDFKDEIVFMHTGRKVVQIQLNEIENVRLLGF